MKLGRRSLNWFQRWWWVLALTLTVTIAVGGAYWISDSPSPLNAVGTLSSLLLSVLLVYIYSRQNKVLERQEMIFENQYDLQEATEVLPELNTLDWSLQSGGESLTVELENVREGDAYRVSFTTTTTIVTDDIEDISGGVWEEQRRYHVRGYDDAIITGSLQYPIEESRREDYGGFEKLFRRVAGDWISDTADDSKSFSSFERWSEEVVRRYREQGHDDAITVSVEIGIRYEDSTGEEIFDILTTGSFVIDGITRLSSSGSDLLCTVLKPKMRFYKPEQIDSDKHIGSIPNNCLGFEIENGGEITVSVSQIRSRCHAVIDGAEVPTTIASDEREITIEGICLEPLFHDLSKDQTLLKKGDDMIFMVQYMFLKSDSSGETQLISMQELVEDIKEYDFNHPLSLSLEVEYSDSAGNTYKYIDNVKDIHP